MTLHLLALETSSSICDVAVLSSVGNTIRMYTASNDETSRHAECLLPMVDQVLEQAAISRDQLAAVAFGQGPGGFTGLRVASGVAQGLAFGLGVPVIPVTSLQAVAVRASQDADGSPHRPGVRYLVVQDARMGEVYFAVYESPHAPGSDFQARPSDSVWTTIQAPILIDATHVQAWLNRHAPGWGLSPETPVYITGDGLDAYPFLADISSTHGRVQQAGSWRADATTIARLALSAWRRGDTLAPEYAVPLYVRDKVAFTTAERQQGAGGNPRAPVQNITLDIMTADHLDAVATIEARVQAFPWTRRNFADGLDAGYSAWVARQDGQVVGFYMAMMAPDIAHLLVIAVDPDHQGQGVGKLLLDHCQQDAAAEGLNTMVLEVRRSNHTAIRFYERQGFEAFSERKDYYPAPKNTREDARVMKKSWPSSKVLA